MGYFACSIGEVSSAIIQKYIEKPRMMRLYEQGSSHRLKAVGFRPNYVGGIFYEKSLAERFYRYYCKLNRLPSRIDPETPLAANG